MRSLFTALLGVLALGSSGCLVVDGGGPQPPPRSVAREHGPPPHAPAHGYRYRHRGHDLAFDSDLGVYVVLGLPDVWFFQSSYVRWFGDHWEIGIDVDGPWRVAAVNEIPLRLREKRHPHGGPPGQRKKRGKP
jgi:hypothetical protein